ncbi:MAG: hypothetical protein LBD11_07495 [Candidatus Peribacteria bacterium]|jgi:hypothetical protein|nr:hypothetical protein [Candidatus Peribacteria bacterium]
MTAPLLSFADQRFSKKLITDFYYKDTNVKNSSEKIFDTFLHSKEEGGAKYGKKHNLTLLDIPYCPNPVEDKDLFLLFHAFKGMRDFFQFKDENNLYYPTDISAEGLVKLNDILDLAGKHSRKQGIAKHFFSDTLKDWCEVVEHPTDPAKWKVYFHIKNKQEYNNFLKKLTTHTLNPENYAFNERSGRFLKNVLNYADIKNNTIYEERRILFQYVMKQVFGDCLGVEDIPTENKSESVHGDFEIRTDTIQQCVIKGELLNVYLNASVKGQNSAVNKLDTDRNFRTSEATNDMLRGQIHGDNYEKTIKILHHFIEYFFQNSKRCFIHKEDALRKGLKIKDKKLIKTTEVGYQEVLYDLPEGPAKEMILSALFFEDERKDNTSKEYVDAKLIIPIKMRGKSFNFELKFVLPNRKETNEKGESRHEVYKAGADMSNISRHKKSVFENNVIQKAEEALEKSPGLVDDLAKGHKDRARQNLVKHILSSLEKVILPTGESYYLTKGTYSLYKNKGFLPEHTVTADEVEEEE